MILGFSAVKLLQSNPKLETFSFDVEIYCISKGDEFGLKQPASEFVEGRETFLMIVAISTQIGTSARLGLYRGGYTFSQQKLSQG